MKPKLLFVSGHVPSPDIPQAGHRLAYETLVEFSKTYDVFLLAFINEIEQQDYKPEKLTPYCVEVHIIRYFKMQKLLSMLLHFWLPVRGTTRISGSAEKAIRNIMANHKIDRVYFEYSEIAYLGKWCRSISPRTLTIQDVIFQGMQRVAAQSGGLKKWLIRFDAGRMKKWEVENYGFFDEVKVLSEKDRDLLLSFGFPKDKVAVVIPKPDKKFHAVKRNRIQPFSILFFAAFNRPENHDGAIWFIDYILPKVKVRFPETLVYIVGANPRKDLTDRAGKGVSVTGFVDDPLPYFELCSLAVAPLRLGAGVKIKVLEYLAAKIPVVATTVGAEGIENELITVADTTDAFADAIIQSFEGKKR